jgi:hypothetical protein
VVCLRSLDAWLPDAAVVALSLSWRSDVLTRSEADCAELIGRLSQREDAAWLADILIEIESDPDDITRLRISEALRRTL